MSLFSKASWFVEYMRFFTSVADVRAFTQLRKNQTRSTQEVTLSVRRIPGATLVCRPGTSDAQVLWDVFWGKYHLPEGDLPPDPVIFDLGANVGFSCFDFSTVFPGARIIGVEMDVDNVAQARRNTAALGEGCQITHAAIWREDGEVSYSKDDEEWGYSISGADGGSANVVVRALSIETLMQETGTDWIDYMKMDIEGAEDAVLAPDASWLQRVGKLSVELHAPATYEKCSEILTKAGFACEKSKRHKNTILATRAEH